MLLSDLVTKIIHTLKDKTAIATLAGLVTLGLTQRVWNYYKHPPRNSSKTTDKLHLPIYTQLYFAYLYSNSIFAHIINPHTRLSNMSRDFHSIIWTPTHILRKGTDFTIFL